MKLRDPFVVTVTFDSNHTGYVVMSRPVTANQVSEIIKYASSAEEQIEFYPISEYERSKSALIFSFHANLETSQITFSSNDGSVTIQNIIDLRNPKSYINRHFLLNFYSNNRSEISILRRKAIQSVAEKCECVIKENANENNCNCLMNRWPLFIHTLCLMVLDPQKHYNKILSNFEELKNECDQQRSLMYNDMAANFQVENILNKMVGNGKRAIDEIITKSDEDSRLRLFNIGLPNLNHLVFLSGFITSLDLSDNMISDMRVLAVMPRLTYLILDGNTITSIHHLGTLRKLKFLSVSRTMVHLFEDVFEVLQHKCLERFVFCETPLARNDKECSLLSIKCRELGKDLTLIRYWL